MTFLSGTPLPISLLANRFIPPRYIILTVADTVPAVGSMTKFP